VLLPEPAAPIKITPIRCSHATCSCKTFSTCTGTGRELKHTNLDRPLVTHYP
jgi:hypothetical protein